jgi:hypothetical protein
MLGGGGGRIEVGALQQVAGRRRERSGALDRQVGRDVQEFARVEQPPPGIIVHPLAGDDHGRLPGQFR